MCLAGMIRGIKYLTLSTQRLAEVSGQNTLNPVTQEYDKEKERERREKHFVGGTNSLMMPRLIYLPLLFSPFLLVMDEFQKQSSYQIFIAKFRCNDANRMNIHLAALCSLMFRVESAGEIGLFFVVISWKIAEYFLMHWRPCYENESGCSRDKLCFNSYSNRRRILQIYYIYMQ